MERKIRRLECHPLDWEMHGLERITLIPESLREYLEGFRTDITHEAQRKAWENEHEELAAKKLAAKNEVAMTGHDPELKL